MTAYYIVRYALALTLLWFSTRRIPSELRDYARYMGVFLMIPMPPYDSAWWRDVWVPLDLVGNYLSFRFSLALWRGATNRRTFFWERVQVGAAASLVGVSACLLAIAISPHVPANGFQAYTIARQYWRIILTVAFGCGTWYWYRGRTTGVLEEALCWWWIFWLAGQAIVGMFGAAGLLHVYREWWTLAGTMEMGMKVSMLLGLGFVSGRRCD